MSAPALATPKGGGPKTAAGKARSSQNARKHGLTTGYLTLTEEEHEQYDILATELYYCLEPAGPLEAHAVEQIAAAAFRLHKIQKLIAGLEAQYGADPLIVPDALAMLKQLDRYRAKEEMRLYRGYQQIEEYQTRRAARTLHVLDEEDHFLPALIEPRLFAKTDCTLADRMQRIYNSPLGPGHPGTPVGNQEHGTERAERPNEQPENDFRQNELENDFWDAIPESVKVELAQLTEQDLRILGLDQILQNKPFPPGFFYPVKE